MKKRLTICIIGLFCLTSAFAQNQGRFLDIQLGGGLHSMQYHNLDGSNNYGGGGLFGVSYRYMFHKNWGFGVGFELNYAHATLQLDAIRQVYDAKNDKTINYTYENFFEDNNFLDLNVPVEMLFQTSINDKWSFLCGLGVKLSFYEYNNFAANGIIDDGTTRIEDFSASERLGANLPTIGCDAVIDLGFHYSFNEHIAIYTGLYAAYGLTNHSVADSRPLYGGEYSYGGVMGSNACPYVNSVSTGIKIGFTYGFPAPNSWDDGSTEESAPAPFSVAY